MTPEQVENWFTHHPPTDQATIESYQIIRDAGKTLALAIIAYSPASADQTAAVRKVREAVMTANAAIACGGK